MATFDQFVSSLRLEFGEQGAGLCFSQRKRIFMSEALVTFWELRSG